MFIPASEEELQQTLHAGTLVEGPGLEFKRELPRPGRNKDLARDICAMTVDGGVLLYGLTGEDPTRPSELAPIELRGACERIDQVAQTAIAEPPLIELHEIRSDRGEGLGYLAVALPASARAPHMVTLDGENRYWGRGATGNRVLGEQEVERLYARRAEWESSQKGQLDDAVAACPFRTLPEGSVATLTAFARPLARRSELLLDAAGTRDAIEDVLGALTARAGGHDPYPDQGDVSLDACRLVRRRGSEVWVLEDGRPDQAEYRAELEVTMPGDLRFWQRPLGRQERNLFTLLERSVTRGTAQFLEAASELLDRASYLGQVDVGIAVSGIESAVGATRNRPPFDPPLFGAPAYRRHARVSSRELGDIAEVTGRLLMPLFDVISIREYDPFGDR